MLDIKFIRDNKKEVAKAAKNKNIKIDLDALLELDDQRKSLQKEIDTLRTQRNEIAELLKDASKRTPEVMEKGKELKNGLAALELRETDVLNEYNTLMLKVPNVYSKDTPVGKDDSENEVFSTVGEPTTFAFEIKDHITLGKDLDILDLERGVKVGGFRGYFLKNEGALMHMAVLQYALAKLVAKGFTPMIPPIIVREEAMVNMGQFPAFRAETFKLSNAVPSTELGAGDHEIKEDRFLAGTSEVGLLNYYAGEIIDKASLPIKMCAYSQCYRSEVGSYGKDTKGIYRIHEFGKVEQVILCEADSEEGIKLHEELLKISEEILSELGLPYRVLKICTGDMGAAKYRMYDLEAWMPSRNGYGETHSDSFLTDWQSRRANIRYKDGDEIKFAYTLNNTAIASPRVLIALWENYQQADGSIVVPEVLRPYMGGKSLITKKK